MASHETGYQCCWYFCVRSLQFGELEGRGSVYSSNEVSNANIQIYFETAATCYRQMLLPDRSAWKKYISRLLCRQMMKCNGDDE